LPPPVSDQTEEDFPNAGTPIPPPQAPAAPAPVETAKKVAVILGPGGAKAFAHVGVLKALQQNRVPIDKVVGLEWGALVGALFASKGQVHELEWKLYKMEQHNLPYTKGLFNSKGPGEQSAKVMDGFIQEAVGRDDVSKAKVEFTCPSRTIWTGVVAWQTRGSLAEAVKRCLPYPPVFKSQGTFIAGATASTEAIERLIKEGFNVIILVNVLGSAMPFAQENLLENLNHVILWQEVKRSVMEAAKYNVDIINVDTGTSAVDFGAKKDLIVLGEKAGAAAAANLITKYRF
jgi:NTE family protein